MMGSQANLLVGIEAHANLPVLDLGMLLQIDHRLYNLRNTRFVISAQERGTVCHDEILADMVAQLGEFLHRSDDALRQEDVCAVIFFYDARLHILARSVRTGVHVGNEADGGHLLVSVGHLPVDVSWQCGIEIAQFVQFHLLQTLGDEFFFQMLCKDPLLLGGRCHVGLLRRLCVEGDVAQKTFNDIHAFSRFSCPFLV